MLLFRLEFAKIVRFYFDMTVPFVMLKSIGRYRNMSNEISLVMGSSSDWSTMKEAANILDEFGVKYDKAVISAHRMPQKCLNLHRVRFLQA